MDDFRLRVKFWGVRGSIATPLPTHLGYGGNTPCVEMRLDTGEVFVFDAGTGALPLGWSLHREFQNRDLEVRLFLTHFHWDHIQGLPFFAPLFNPRAQLTLHGIGDFETFLVRQMEPPFFPIRLHDGSSRKTFLEIDESPLRFGDLVIRPFPVRHTQEARGFRIEYAGKVVVYATDFEHGDAEADDTLRSFSRQADLLILDSQFEPEEYHLHRGWGHSTWLEATRVALDSQVSRLMLFHHDPAHTDFAMDGIVAEARKHFPATDGAREGLSIDF